MKAHAKGRDTDISEFQNKLAWKFGGTYQNNLKCILAQSGACNRFRHGTVDTTARVDTEKVVFQEIKEGGKDNEKCSDHKVCSQDEVEEIYGETASRNQ